MKLQINIEEKKSAAEEDEQIKKNKFKTKKDKLMREINQKIWNEEKEVKKSMKRGKEKEKKKKERKRRRK